MAREWSHKEARDAISERERGSVDIGPTFVSNVQLGWELE
jgi:hypothetical protein